RRAPSLACGILVRLYPWVHPCCHRKRDCAGPLERMTLDIKYIIGTCYLCVCVLICFMIGPGQRSCACFSLLSHSRRPHIPCSARSASLEGSPLRSLLLLSPTFPRL